MNEESKYLNPGAYAERRIIQAIVSGKFPIGGKLVPERELANTLGITRPTLREVLQRLASDGWITIRHGRPTVVNDYRTESGLSILKQIAHFGEGITQKVILDWLELRVLILPKLTRNAIKSGADELRRFLRARPTEEADSTDIASYDLELQLLIVNLSDNFIARMLYNDLTSVYLLHARDYFSVQHNRNSSFKYYRKLENCILNNNVQCEQIVKEAMCESIRNWLSISIKINPKQDEN